MEEDPAYKPTVFISYSHDSREHKEWVAKLALALLDHGIQVLVDHFDVGFGDDIPKYMERSVSVADRVLMVCTEPYVRKADDGKGGVGYEAMIVTSELVLNLGTNKFIPVIRQQGDAPKVTPRCVSTRRYADLSTNQSWEENFPELVAEIKRLPKNKKPTTTSAPITEGEFESEGKKVARRKRSEEFADALASPEAAYQMASDIIRSNDRVAWRKLLLASMDHGASKAKTWAERLNPPREFTIDPPDKLFVDVRMGIEGYMPAIACLLAAAESGEPEYAGQLGWVDTMYSPPGWKHEGSVYLVRLPETVLFVTQALVGGMLMESGSGEAAYRLACTKVKNKFQTDVEPIFSQSRVNGWPDTLMHRCTTAWQFLDSLVENWGWLKEPFGSETACRAGITSYYILMDFLNFVRMAKQDKIEVDRRPQDRGLTSTSLCCLRWPEDTVVQGYRVFLRQRDVLAKLLQSNQIDLARAATLWPVWMLEVGSWLGSVFQGYGYRGTLPHKELFKDWNRDAYSLD